MQYTQKNGWKRLHIPKKSFKLFNPHDIETYAKEIGFKEVEILSLKDGNAFIINCKK